MQLQHSSTHDVLRRVRAGALQRLGHRRAAKAHALCVCGPTLAGDAESCGSNAMVAAVPHGMRRRQARLHRPSLQHPQPRGCAGTQRHCRPTSARVWDAGPEPCPAARLQRRRLQTGQQGLGLRGVCGIRQKCRAWVLLLASPGFMT